MTPYLDTLTGFLKIPSVSTQPEHVADMATARQFLLDLFHSLQFTTRVLPSVVHPAVYASSPFHPEHPTVLIYGHYDVQPPGAPSQWTTPAWEPSVRKGRIYARGASDNKGQILIHILSARELVEKFGPDNLPINLKFIIEGEEEIGSPGVEMLLKSYPDLFQADYVILSDTEMISSGHPSIDVSLRGVMDVEVEIQTGSHDLHSGQFGGLAPNPAFILTHILGNLKNGEGRITIPGFYDSVIPLTAQESADFHHLEPKKSGLLKDGHFYYLGGGEADHSLNDRRWSRPTLDITGLDSGYTGFGIKSIIPNIASAKLSMRLVPNQHPHIIYQSLVRLLQKLTPKRACLRIFMHPAALPYKAPTDHPVYALAKDTLKASFGHTPVFTGQGASIGFVPKLAESLSVPCVMIGFGLPDDNCHAPNEFLSLENFEKGIQAVCLFYSRIPGLKTKTHHHSASDLTKSIEFSTITDI